MGARSYHKEEWAALLHGRDRDRTPLEKAYRSSEGKVNSPARANPASSHMDGDLDMNDGPILLMAPLKLTSQLMVPTSQLTLIMVLRKLTSQLPHC